MVRKKPAAKKKKVPLPKSSENWKVIDPKNAKKEITAILEKKPAAAGSKKSAPVKKKPEEKTHRDRRRNAHDLRPGGTS